MNRSAASWIKRLNMNAHAEGGWYSEVYRSPILLTHSQLPSTFTGDRNACTHIYFLLEKGNFSAFHRIRSDELWHFYDGNPIVVYEIDNSGTLYTHLLGNNPEKDQLPFCFIKAGNWFASKVADGDFGLVGCTVAPGFDFADFEMANKEELVAAYPEHRVLIQELTR